ncbi:MAG: hypothetical protein WCI68_06260 [Actinomycetes bacterium]
MRTTMKIFYALLLSISVVTSAVSGTLPAHSSTSASPSIGPTVPSIGFGASDDSLIETMSYVTGFSYPEGATSGLYTRRVSCTSVDDVACASADSIFAQLILQPCSASVKEMCVESLEVSDTKGVLKKATYGYELPGQKYPASKVRNSPAGGTPSIWNAKESPNSSGANEYAVVVSTTSQNYQNKGCAQFVTAPCAFIRGFRARVYPINLGSNTEANQSCLWSEGQKCAKKVDFSPGARAALTVRMDNSLTGFLFGRIKNVTLDLTALTSSTNLIRVEADPIDVPEIYAYVAKSDLSRYPKIVEYWKVRRQQLAADDFTSKDTVGAGASPEWAMGDFEAFEDLVKSGPLVSSIWRFGTQTVPPTASGSKCFDDKSKLQGLVTTNAPTYEPKPPTFANGELTYKVAGAHYLADGVTLFKGSYDLVLRSEFARCLYGFSNAPISAKVSVVSTDGSTQDIATESLREDEARQWLYLSAKNFTFSAPTIKVKLTQEKPVVIVKEDSARSPSPVVVKKVITITCAKGKITKKYSGANPKCPSGYKKK